MIRVTVELISANTGDVTLLGVAEISNDGETSKTQGDLFGSYHVRMDEAPGPLCDYDVRLSKWAPKQRETWLRGRVLRFNRKARGAWDLLYIALRQLVGHRNP